VRRLCERPGCAGPAEVSYGIDNASLTVWVDNTALSEREMAGRLCRRHANALSVPRGWTIDDRRDPTPKLFRVSDEPVQSKKPRVKRDVTAKIERPRPSLFENNPEPEKIEVVVEEQRQPDPDETKAIPWSPRLVDTSDDESEIPVFGRLLGRAFGQSSSDD